MLFVKCKCQLFFFISYFCTIPETASVGTPPQKRPRMDKNNDKTIYSL